MQEREFEREAMRRLPALLGELFDPEQPELRVEPRSGPGGRLAVVVGAAERRWVIELKSSGSPGIVAAVAEQKLDGAVGDEQGIPLLVVPYMGTAGAATASARGLNWVDLSGNARLHADGLLVRVEGRPNQFPKRGRPSTPFAPKSARVARILLCDPSRWWRQADLVEVTGLDDGHLSRIVRRMDEDRLLKYRDGEFRPDDPEVLLDAWSEDYRFARHDVVSGHVTGSGVDLAVDLHQRLAALDRKHAFTGLAAAWALRHHSQFRLVSVYVDGDPREVADAVGVRSEPRGANVQLIGPDDDGVFDCGREVDDYPIVSPAQAYLDLLHLPERAAEAAQDLRGDPALRVVSA